MDNKNSTQEVCYEVLKGAQMGIDAIDELLKRCDDKSFVDVLLHTQNDYKKVAHDADVILQKNGGIPHELSAGIRMTTWGMVKSRTMNDNSPSRLSELILRGMDTAQKEMNEIKRENPDAHESSHKLADKLLKLQKEHRGIYESYLQK